MFKWTHYFGGNSIGNEENNEGDLSKIFDLAKSLKLILTNCNDNVSKNQLLAFYFTYHYKHVLLTKNEGLLDWDIKIGQ